jgi:integrase
VFRGETDKPHRHRTWPNGVLRKYHAEGVTPRTFRRTLATNWGEDLRSLMSQGGWSDPKTILLHYRRDVRERHIREAEKVLGAVRDEDPDPGLPGYG